MHRTRYLIGLLLSVIVLEVLDSTALAQNAAAENSPLQPHSAALAMAGTPEGRQLLDYLVSCALAEGKDLTLDVEGTTYQFSGSMGLAKDWLEQPLSPSEERWVSACILARTNAFGIKVQISMRGAHDALQASMVPGETESFPVEEAAFYGNIFSSEAVAYVCRGEQALPSRHLTDRVCAESSDTPPLTKCRFLLTGQCKDVCAFQDDSDGHYGRCQGPDKIYSEVVTVYLKSD